MRIKRNAGAAHLMEMSDQWPRGHQFSPSLVRVRSNLARSRRSLGQLWQTSAGPCPETIRFRPTAEVGRSRPHSTRKRRSVACCRPYGVVWSSGSLPAGIRLGRHLPWLRPNLGHLGQRNDMCAGTRNCATQHTHGRRSLSVVLGAQVAAKTRTGAAPALAPPGPPPAPAARAGDGRPRRPWQLSAACASSLVARHGAGVGRAHHDQGLRRWGPCGEGAQMGLQLHAGLAAVDGGRALRPRRIVRRRLAGDLGWEAPGARGVSSAKFHRRLGVSPCWIPPKREVVLRVTCRA